MQHHWMCPCIVHELLEGRHMSFWSTELQSKCRHPLSRSRIDLPGYDSAKGSAHLGFTILSFAGKLIQSWKPHRSPSVTLGISECTMPRPAVIHCTPPGPITPCKARRLHHALAEHHDTSCCTYIPTGDKPKLVLKAAHSANV